MTKALFSFVLLIVAGLFEIVARWLGWGWLRRGWGATWGFAAAAAMLASLLLPALQEQHFEFGRSSAGYGVLFVVLALSWSWIVDRKPLDTADFIGSALCLVGLSIMMYWPRA